MRNILTDLRHNLYFFSILNLQEKHNLQVVKMSFQLFVSGHRLKIYGIFKLSFNKFNTTGPLLDDPPFWPFQDKKKVFFTSEKV